MMNRNGVAAPPADPALDEEVLVTISVGEAIEIVNMARAFAPQQPTGAGMIMLGRIMSRFELVLETWTGEHERKLREAPQEASG